VLIFGILFAAVAAVLTLISMLMATSEAYPFSFDFGMIIIVPAVIVGRALGLPDGKNPLLWALLAVVLNTAICFSVGALVGWIVSLVVRCFSKSDRMEGSEKNTKIGR